MGTQWCGKCGEFSCVCHRMPHNIIRECHAEIDRLKNAKPSGGGPDFREDSSPDAVRIENEELKADLKALRAACEKLGAEVARVHGIAQTHLHPDRSISLEAQGYDQIDCAVIGAVDSMAAKILNSNPPLGIESPIKTLLADPIAAKYIKEAT